MHSNRRLWNLFVATLGGVVTFSGVKCVDAFVNNAQHNSFRSSWTLSRKDYPTLSRCRTRVAYAKDEDRVPELSASQPQLKTNFLDRHAAWLDQWLCSLNQIERSEPTWVGSNLLHISPYMLVNEHLQSLVPHCPEPLFSNEAERAKFDWDWKYALLRLLSADAELPIILHSGMSNSHPLRMQLVAIPPHTCLPLHVHPAVELDIPIFGSLYERRTNTRIEAGHLQRNTHHAVGSPLSHYHNPPTRDELAAVAKDLSSRIVLADHGTDGAFVETTIRRGQCLINEAGSVHQSFTKNEPCLLLVLGPNVHAHFLPGNFRQREGVSCLTGIEDLFAG